MPDAQTADITAIVVTHPFADYSVGQQITDPEVIATLMQTQRERVVPVVGDPARVSAEEAAQGMTAAPAPAPKPAQTKATTAADDSAKYGLTFRPQEHPR